MRNSPYLPAWVVLLALVLTAIEPVTHAWINRIDRPDAVASGLHRPDSAIYLQCMRMFQNGFHSPYATCKAPEGSESTEYLPTPFHWLYAMVGFAGHLTGMNPFLWLGIVNGIGGFVYLLVVYRFLAIVAPNRARLAFLLFTFAGGLGGIGYLVSIVFGLNETSFIRYGGYELIEGPYMSPVLHVPRLYYTTSLAAALGAVTVCARALTTRSPRLLKFSGTLIFFGTLINMRIGALAFVVALLYVLFNDFPRHHTIRAALTLGAGTTLGVISFFLVSLRNVVFVENTVELVRENMWFAPFVSAALFHLLLLPWAVKLIMPGTRDGERWVVYCLLGYLGAFTLLYLGYQAYYGPFERVAGGFVITADASAAVRISDWAIVGAVIGGIGARVVTRGPRTYTDRELVWVLIWFFLFCAVALSAFRQGWFLRFTPQRFMMFLGLPLSLLSAHVLHAMAGDKRRRAICWITAMVTCGVISIVVGSLYVQGPFHREAGSGQAILHTEIIAPEDAALVANLPDGTFLAPYPMSDVLALRAGVSVLGGIGSTDLSDQPSVELMPEIERFFTVSPEMETNPGDADGNAESRSAAGDLLDAESRAAFIEEWCVDFIVLPKTWPVDARLEEILDRMPNVEPMNEPPLPRLYRVLRGGANP